MDTSSTLSSTSSSSISSSVSSLPYEGLGLEHVRDLHMFERWQCERMDVMDQGDILIHIPRQIQVQRKSAMVCFFRSPSTIRFFEIELFMI
jgi:hypothetical protein